MRKVTPHGILVRRKFGGMKPLCFARPRWRIEKSRRIMAQRHDLQWAVGCNVECETHGSLIAFPHRWRRVARPGGCVFAQHNTAEARTTIKHLPANRKPAGSSRREDH